MRAWKLHGEGWSGKDIAAALKVSAGAVSGWLKQARAGGVEALRRHPASGPDPNGRLFAHIQDQAFRGPAIVAFLRQLLRQVPGKLLVIWDGVSIHHAQPVKDFLAAGAAARLHLERLPGSAPDLNPDESVWKQLLRVELANRCGQDLDELRWELGLAIRRLRRKVHVS